MKKYYNPEIELVLLSDEDVITTSGGMTVGLEGFGFGSDDNNTWVW